MGSKSHAAAICRLTLAYCVAAALALVGIAGCSQAADEPDDSPRADVKAKCFDVDKDTPRALIEPLVEVLDEHTSRRDYNAQRDTYTVDVRYFVGAVAAPDHEPLPADYQPYMPGESSPADHAIFLHTRATMTPSDGRWGVTLHGEMDAHPYYGGKAWAIEVDAALDAETCDATLERVVAGPDRIALYP